MKRLVNLKNGGYPPKVGTETSDSIPAVLPAGGFVLRAKAAKMLGRKKLEKLNQAGPPGPAAGVPAKVSKNEFVIRPSAAKAIGKEELDEMNKGKGKSKHNRGLRGFAGGGGIGAERDKAIEDILKEGTKQPGNPSKREGNINATGFDQVGKEPKGFFQRAYDRMRGKKEKEKGYAGGGMIDMLRDRGRSIDEQVEGAELGTKPAPAVAPSAQPTAKPAIDVNTPTDTTPYPKRPSLLKRLGFKAGGMVPKKGKRC
jgi:hypothetical protein